jgi:hypothetical protein
VSPLIWTLNAITFLGAPYAKIAITGTYMGETPTLLCLIAMLLSLIGREIAIGNRRRGP